MTHPAPALHPWLDDSFVWLPERGVGWYLVTEPPEEVYDEAYFRRYQRMAETDLGRELTGIRIELLRRHTRARPERIVDVGVGAGQFVDAAGCRGYDVMRPAVVWLKDRRAWTDPREQPVDVATFWDSLEHIADADRIIRNVRHWVFLSLPIVPGHGPPPMDWKHLRRDEHCLYFTRDGLIRWMQAQGFRCVEHNTAESLAGREDIGSFAFRRVETWTG